MKNVIKAITTVSFLGSILCVIIAVINHNTDMATGAIYLMLLAGVIYILKGLITFCRLMSQKMDNPERNRANGFPAHRLWPMWLFLAFFIIEAAMVTACAYFATHIWSVRDLLNFELTAILTLNVTYWFTNTLPTKLK